MNTKNWMRHLAWGVLGLVSNQAYSQATQANNAGGANSFLGWNANANQVLEVRNNANQPIEWYTDSLQRMWLTPTLTGQTMNGYTGLDLSGHLGIGRFDAPVTTPLAMLHLDSAGSQLTGYRPWMGTGTLMTKLSDMMYVGMLGLSDDRNDAVIGWSDNAGANPSQGPDRLRFIFTQRVFDPPNHVGQTYYGLEMARMVPDAAGDEGFIGLGDWATAGLEPVERLDVLDGNVRIRALPGLPSMDTAQKVVVVNEVGVLGWQDLATLSTENAWSITGNANIVEGTHFLGTHHTAPVDLRTDSIHRLRLLPEASYGIGTYGGQVKSGNVLLSPDVEQFYAEGGPGPYSLLHLADSANNAQQLGYRPWMRNGITLTGNADEMYVGQLYRSEDVTDAVICWSDNPGSFLADRFTLRFTSTPVAQATQGSGSEQGLQTLLVQPDADGEQAYVGIGDFDAASETPEERLDVLDGRVRIRELPNEQAADTLEKFVVVNEDGVLGWRNIPPGSLGCEWNQFGVANNLRTAWSGAASGCPDEESHVGVGSGGTLPGKLTVVESATKPSTAEHGIHVTMNADDETNNGVTVKVVNKPNTTSNISNGVHVESENAGGTTTGLYARGHLASGRSATGDIIGVEAESTVYGPADEAFGTRSEALIHPGSELTKDAIGVYGLARSFTDSENAARILYGVHGRVIAPSPYSIEQRAVYGESNTCSDCWAGYFKGKVKITGDGFVNGNVLRWSTRSGQV